MVKEPSWARTQAGWLGTGFDLCCAVAARLPVKDTITPPLPMVLGKRPCCFLALLRGPPMLTLDKATTGTGWGPRPPTLSRPPPVFD